ncbi:class D beta-lactamase [Corallincola platygyrae]|uniref:Beta-lactamase n=1 Tax=Corallincola platygyrae TaxID=1193278 RepID=A0ABW4XJC5_9GAMM
MRYLLFIFGYLLATNATAEDAELAQLFVSKAVTGTLVLQSLDGDQTHTHNLERAIQRLLPASTFKIPNSLIALDEGAVTGTDEVLKWDGKDKGWAPWNQNHTMASALPVSCVWCYQELATRIGMTKYQAHLKQLDYGNQTPKPELTTFWLTGDLAISANEQITFLRSFYNETLPYSKTHIQAVKRLLLVTEGKDYRVYGKTGWAANIEHPHGWYVGYVENQNQTWLFAMNIDMPERKMAPYRKQIVMEALALKSIISPNSITKSSP